MVNPHPFLASCPAHARRRVAARHRPSSQAHRTMKKLKLVMVGNGMAGVRTLEELLKIAPDLYDITVFGAEPHPNYNRILLSPVLAGEQTIEQIILNPLSWYAEHGITLHLGKKVARVDRVKRRVIADSVSIARS